MKQVYKDLFVYAKELTEQNKIVALCITTNGFVKKNGECVMGRGCAKQIANSYPEMPLLLGKKIKQNGNIVQPICDLGDNIVVVAFPVKHNWWEEADTQLIQKSCIQLMTLTKDKNMEILLPRPGCGNGKLKWEEVKILIENVLDNKVTIMHK